MRGTGHRKCWCAGCCTGILRMFLWSTGSVVSCGRLAVVIVLIRVFCASIYVLAEGCPTCAVLFFRDVVARAGFRMVLTISALLVCCFAVQVEIPLVTTNRINMPDTAEKVLAEGHADMISMARYSLPEDC